MFKPLLKSAHLPERRGLVFSPGVAASHLLAAEKGADGERYILTDTYADFGELPRQWSASLAADASTPYCRSPSRAGRWERNIEWSAARR